MQVDGLEDIERDELASNDLYGSLCARKSNKQDPCFCCHLRTHTPKRSLRRGSGVRRMILANSGAFVLILGINLIGVKNILAEMGIDNLIHDNGMPVELQTPAKRDGYHLYISHVWP